MTEVQNVVLVHGGFVDGSGWEGVYHLLKEAGLNVQIVQNSTVSLDCDVAATEAVLDQQDGPTLLVGHSYGGVVITAAGTHDNVAGLVYIAAFAPDQGESVQTLIADPPPGAPVPPILPPQDGFLLLDRDQLRGVVRRRPPRGAGGVHGRRAGSVGPRRPRRRRDHPGLAVQAQLVPGGDRRPDDPAARAAGHGRTGRRDRHRDPGQPRHLRVLAQGRRRPDQAGRQRLTGPASR